MKPIIDFQILQSSDPRVILLADNSVWAHIENKKAIIEITTPGAEDPVTLYWQKGKINSYNSANLLLECAPDCSCEDGGWSLLPDGLYGFKIKGSPDIFNCEKKFLFTRNTRLKLDKLYVDLKLSCENINPGKEAILNEIDMFLKYADACVRLSFISDAQDALFKAQKMIEKYTSTNRY